MKLLEEINTHSDGQFGFRRGRSCITNLLSFYSRHRVDCIYLNLKKAFDKVPNKRLEIRRCRNIEGWFAEIDGRVFEQQKNENSNKRSEVRMV